MTNVEIGTALKRATTTPGCSSCTGEFESKTQESLAWAVFRKSPDTTNSSRDNSEGSGTIWTAITSGHLMACPIKPMPTVSITEKCRNVPRWINHKSAAGQILEVSNLVKTLGAHKGPQSGKVRVPQQTGAYLPWGKQGFPQVTVIAEWLLQRQSFSSSRVSWF